MLRPKYERKTTKDFAQSRVANRSHRLPEARSVDGQNLTHVDDA